MKPIFRIIFIILLIFPIEISSQIVYEITKHNSNNVSYLVGSHHYLSVSSLKNNNKVYKAFNDCDIVLGEVYLNEDSINSFSHYIYSDKSIFSLCNERESELIDSVCTKLLGVGLKQMQYFKPIMISNMLVQTLLDAYYPKNDDSMMDSFFQKVAVQQSKEVFGLESIEDQMKLIFTLKSLENQAKELYEVASSYEDFSKEISKIDSLYQIGDLSLLYNEYQNDSTTSEGEKFLMLDARNLNWINKIDKYLTNNNCFVIVGALHLYGENGLINLLKKKGYKVKPK